MKLSLHRIIALPLFVLCSLLPGVAAAEQLSRAERFGLELAADFLDRGAVAVYERLAKSSPLAAMPRAEAMAQIEARVGPETDARWTLAALVRKLEAEHVVFDSSDPSGFEETILFVLVPEGDVVRVKEIRLPSDGGELESESPSGGTATEIAPVRRRIPPFVAVAGVVVLLGCAVLARRSKPATMALGACALALAVVSFVWIAPRGGEAVEKTTAPPQGSARALADFRAAIAKDLGAPFPQGRLSRAEESRARQWVAMARAIEGDVEGAKAALAQVAGTTLLTEIVSARLESFANKPAEAATHYATAHQFELFTDTLAREELATALLSVDNRIGAEEIEAVAGRDAASYYLAATQAERSSRTEGRTASLFRRGWELRPATREFVIREVIAGLDASADEIAQIAGLTTPEEQLSRSSDLSTAPIAVPASAKSYSSGEFVRIVVRDGILDVPGGAAAAPGSTQVVDARFWDEFEVERFTRNLERWKELARYRNPTKRVLRELEYATELLVESGRWSDVLELTEAVSPDSLVSPLLLEHKLLALYRSDRYNEVAKYASGAIIASARRSKDVETMMLVAEVLAAARQSQPALALYKDVSRIDSTIDVNYQKDKLTLRIGMAEREPQTTTEHFEIRCARGVPQRLSDTLGELLEEELTRVRKRLGTGPFKRVRVNLVHWENFASYITGSAHVLGIYDGEVTLPYADLIAFDQQLVAIAGHEATHAVIAQATGDRAPRWFQEGVASRMEIGAEQESLFAGRQDDIVSLSLLNEVLLHSNDPHQVVRGYTHARTFFNFVDGTRGASAIPAMIRAYAEGKSDDEVLRSVLGGSVAELDTEFRAWGRGHVEPFRDAAIWPYARFYGAGINPDVTKGIRFSKDPP